jgi:hypothetical protein
MTQPSPLVRFWLRLRHEQQLHDAQAKERKALASAQASRQAIAKADAKEREYQARIDRLREELRAISADWTKRDSAR